MPPGDKACLLLSKACELFILDVTLRAYQNKEDTSKLTITVS